jgi:murein DD-endopeptidase MepM/ murein hydrolase activator NlpD
MNKYISFILLSIILSSCAVNNAARLSQKIRIHMKQNHGIVDGEVVAKFDLAGLEKSDKLFSLKYGSIINNTSKNSEFLDDFDKKYRHTKHLQENSYIKLRYLTNLLDRINANHKILNYSLSKKIKSQISKMRKHPKMDYYANLVDIHNSTKYIPIFKPIENSIITSQFGTRKHPHSNKIIHHCGLDLASKKGSNIYSAADGVVIEVSRSRGYGNNILIKHTNNIKTRYAHLSKFNVKEGEKVILGQSVGIQGSSGTSTGHHLHFEVLVNNKPVNPVDFINHSIDNSQNI